MSLIIYIIYLQKSVKLYWYRFIKIASYQDTGIVVIYSFLWYNINMNYYQQSKTDILQQFHTSEQSGLTTSQVSDLVQQYGKNILQQKEKISPWVILFQQFKSPLIIVLIAATIVSSLIGEIGGGIVILVIVILNAIVWFIQEYKAEKSIESLKKMMSLQSTVVRDGEKIVLDSAELVPWDIVILEEGDKIPADGYVLSFNNLETSESALTGESLPVKKDTEIIEKDVPLWDQHNMVFSGTVVVKWFGIFVVTHTWMDTQIGKIASLIDEIEDKTTHLQKKLANLSKKLWWGVMVICIVVFLSYYFGHELWLSAAFLASVALAVAAIPEWLPTVVTIALSLGVNRMVKKNALMRKLPSVETLWSVNIICSDKTGTLTKNEMTVKEIYLDNKLIHISGTGYDPKGDFSNTSESLTQLLKIGVLCNHATLTEQGEMIGDPTEWCLLVSAKKWWYDKNSFSDYDYQDEIPFDSTRKMMTSIYTHAGQYEMFAKWAPESLLPLSTHILDNGTVRVITDTDREYIINQTTQLAEQAMRVLAFAYKVDEKFDKEQAESNFIFVGLQAIIDPAREEVKEAIAVCKQAGIRVVMITGDNIQTAKAIATRLNITGKAMTGTDLEQLSDTQLFEIIEEYGIFARVNPSHKQRLVQTLQKKGNVVAMTWDGVNDAPALKQSDIGVAMGITGTDVSKEASDMILLDDNFTTIVSAVEEGRGIYDNIKKFVNFLLSTNMAEVLILFILSMMWLPLPLLAIHILWINLVTDGLPALALWVDPINPDIMKRKPVDAKSGIIDNRMLWSMITISVLITIAVIIFFLKRYMIDLEMARTGVLLLLVWLEIMRVQMIRSDYGIGLFSNKRLIWALLLSIILVLGIIYTPLSSFFSTVAPSWIMWWDIGIFIVLTTIVGISVDYVMDKIIEKRIQKKISQTVTPS